MSPLSGPVLGAAAVVTAPALWHAFVSGTQAPDVAMSRFLVAVVVCWAALSVVADFAFPVTGKGSKTDADQQRRADGSRPGDPADG